MTALILLSNDIYSCILLSCLKFWNNSRGYAIYFVSNIFFPVHMLTICKDLSRPTKGIASHVWGNLLTHFSFHRKVTAFLFHWFLIMFKSVAMLLFPFLSSTAISLQFLYLVTAYLHCKSLSPLVFIIYCPNPFAKFYH